MKQIYSLFTVLFLLSILLFSCSEENEEGCDIIKSAENNKYSVVIDSGSSAESRAITDLVQGGGNYSEGSLVKLYTKDRKFMATAVGSAGTTWLQNGDPNSTTILTSSINQDWSVAIKYYSDVILDCTAPGGDGSKVTKALEVGSQLPDPVVTAGYTFEGWYEGGTRVYIVPESSNRTFTAKFNASGFLIVGNQGYIISPFGTLQVGADNWSIIARGKGKYVVMGSNYGMVTTSTNGLTWSEPQRVVGRDYNWFSIAYGNNKFIVVGYGGYSSTSSDGINWTTPQRIGTTSDNWLNIAYENGRFIALRAAMPGSHGGAGYISTSTDGVNWTAPKPVGTVEWRGITYGNGKFVVVGLAGYMALSTDGLNWYLPFEIGTNTWNDVTFGNGRFVAVGSNGGIATSTDGANWSIIKKSEKDIRWESIAYANGKFLVIGTDNNSGVVTTSKDGITWSVPEEVKDVNGQPLTNIKFNAVCDIM